MPLDRWPFQADGNNPVLALERIQALRELLALMVQIVMVMSSHPFATRIRLVLLSTIRQARGK